MIDSNDLAKYKDYLSELTKIKNVILFIYYIYILK
jgi:hypothetical protein